MKFAIFYLAVAATSVIAAPVATQDNAVARDAVPTTPAADFGSYGTYGTYTNYP